MIKKGFSIAEMMVVMLILSIVLAAATPIITHRVIASSNSSSSDSIPSGAIIMWKGALATIPSGWVLCNGSNGTPDLRNRFVVAAGDDSGGHVYGYGWNNIGSYRYKPGDTGGEEQHILTIAETASHNHAYYFGNNPGYSPVFNGVTSENNSPTSYSWVVRYTQYNGGDQPHNNMPPYYALYYIMKL